MTRKFSRSRARFLVSAVVGAGIAFLSALGAVAPAWAHADVVVTSPEANTQVAAPAVIAVGVSEEIVLKYSSLRLTDLSGAIMTTEPPTLDPTGTSMESVVPLKLCPGMYDVRWHVLSVDGHETDGSFAFEVTDNLTEGAPVCDQGNGGNATNDDAGNTPAPVETPPTSATPEPRATILAYDTQAANSDPLVWITVTAWSALAAGILVAAIWLITVFVKRRRVG